ncbi:4-hydroxymandelate oxidase [Catenulispora sp. GAS73]|uniref:alpha-hydroxy acid oxidase n=1 Tax=Catenulispora sp. GAS73 TaxID=3156269 RepID=UPI0035185AF2
MGTQNAAPLRLTDFRDLAAGHVTRPVWDFVDGGSGDERTLAANTSAYDRHRLRPRVLTDVDKIDTRTALFGTALATPVGLAPIAYHRLLHPEGEAATVRGAGRAGALTVVGIFASRTLEDIAEAATGPLWLQLYWLRQRAVLEQLIERAEAGGYEAFVVTLDAKRIGQRLRDMRNGFTLPEGVAAVNVDPAVMAEAHRAHEADSAISAHAEISFDRTLTWEDLAWMRGRTAKPILLKGVLTAEDARLAAEHGVDGIVVSNHGGRQLDNAVASIDALEECVEAVSGSMPVLVDGGIRRGTDVFTALALGADAVLIGRPFLWGLAADGADGVEAVLRMATSELEHTMTLMGTATLADIDRSAVRP